MGSTNKTPILNLSQFADGDKFTWTGDYNADMRKIEAGQKNVGDGLTAANNNLATLLNDVYRKNQVVELLDARDVTDEQTYAKKTELAAQGANAEQVYAKKTDVALKAHTHTASQITDFATEADKRVAAGIEAIPPSNKVLFGNYAQRPLPATAGANSIFVTYDIPEMYLRAGAAPTYAWIPISSGGNTIAKAILSSRFNQTANPGTYQDISGMTVTAKIGERPFVVSFDGNVGIVGATTTAAKHPVIIRITVNGTAVAQGSFYAETNNSFGATGHLHIESELSGYAAGSSVVVKAQIATANGEGGTTGKGLVDADTGRPATLKVVTA